MNRFVCLMVLSSFPLVGIAQTRGIRVNGLPVYSADNFHYVVENGEATITDIKYGVIPCEVNGYTVRKIGHHVMATRIITIPKTVTSIESDAFESSAGLTDISVDPDNTAYSSEAGILFNKPKTILLQCPITKKGPYTIPSSVTSIGEKAFYQCLNLASVTFGNGVTSVGKSAFGLCSSLTNINIPNSVTSIGEKAFDCCTSLTSVTIGNGVTSIGRDAFIGCAILTSITLADGLPAIGASWFANLPITSITIPSSVTSIEANAFGFCTSLTSITIPNSVTSISSSAFSGCERLPKETLEQIKQKEPKY